MNKSVKIGLIVAACLVLAGCVLFTAALGAADWDLKKLGTAEYGKESFELNDAFSRISIRSDTSDITFLPSEDGKCRVELYGPENALRSVTVTDRTLVIEVKAPENWLDRFTLFSFDAPSMTVYLPGAEYEKLDVEESTGDIRIPKDFAFGQVQIGLSTGDIDWAASASGEIRIEGSTGDILLHGTSAGSLVLKVSTGRVELKSVDCKAQIDLSVTTGKNVLTDVSCRELVSTGNTGDISLKNVIAVEQIRLERSTGDVRLEACDASALSIVTTTGDVSGTLLSSKLFRTQTGTGRVDVPDTSAGGECFIRTTTGDIKMSCQKN